jgi:hypothetical protein
MRRFLKYAEDHRGIYVHGGAGLEDEGIIGISWKKIGRIGMLNNHWGYHRGVHGCLMKFYEVIRILQPNISPYISYIAGFYSPNEHLRL